MTSSPSHPPPTHLMPARSCRWVRLLRTVRRLARTWGGDKGGWDRGDTPRDTHPAAGPQAVSPPGQGTAVAPTWAKGVTIMSSPCLREHREREARRGEGVAGDVGWGTLTGRWRWRSCGTWLLGTGRSRCRSGRGRTRGAGRARRFPAGPAPRPGWPGGPARPARGGHSPGQSCQREGTRWARGAWHRELGPGDAAGFSVPPSRSALVTLR